MLSKKSSLLTIDNCIKELEKQSKNPPGGDAVIKNFYRALVKLLHDGEMKKYFEGIIVKREFTPSHFVNLLFRAIQYIELYQIKNENYPAAYMTLAAWEKEIVYIKKSHDQLLSDLLLTRDTTTTVYQRYAGVKIILNALFPNKKLALADFGCGGNYGLPGLELNLEFRPVVDHTGYVSHLSLLEKPLHIAKGLALDKEAPDEASAKVWRLACSFYPQELNKSTDILVLEAEVAHTKNIQFIQYDLTRSLNGHNIFSQKSFDAVIMSTFLYQLNSFDQHEVITLAKKILNKNGILIIQDFAHKNKKNGGELEMINNWFSRPYLYRTFICGSITRWKMKEVLRWQNGRCKEVKKGLDFDWFVNLQSKYSVLY